MVRSRELSVVLVLVVLGVAMLFTSARGAFYSQRNIQNVVQQVALLSIFAIGETIVIITAGIDLSLGSLIGFTGMVAALAVTKLGAGLIAGPAIALAILITLVIAFLIGTVHATLIHKLMLPPFVVTLASLLILRSQSLIMNKQLPIAVADYPALLYLANGTPFGIPMPLVILGVIAVLATLALNRLRVGRYIYSVGSNEQAT